jgi:hypothetical protein
MGILPKSLSTIRQKPDLHPHTYIQLQTTVTRNRRAIVILKLCILLCWTIQQNIYIKHRTQRYKIFIELHVSTPWGHHQVGFLERIKRSTQYCINCKYICKRWDLTSAVPFICSVMCYNERCNKERMLQRTVFINKIRMLQRTRNNTIGRRSTRVRMTCRAFPLWLQTQSSFLLSFVRFGYQFSSFICLYVQYIKVK